MLRKKKEEEIGNDKVRLLADKRLQENLGQHVNECVSYQHSYSNFDEETIDTIDTDIVKKERNEISDVVVGQKIIKNKPLVTNSMISDKQKDKFAIRFKTSLALPENETESVNTTLQQQNATSAKLEKPNLSNEQGIIKYALSDRKFIDMGWTKLPTKKIIRKMNVYRMHPSHPEFDWFAHNQKKGEMLFYNSGEKLAEFTDYGHGRWFYKSGNLALDFYNAEDLNAQQRYVVYSTGESDQAGRCRPRTILASFDYLGNGVVFDHTGKIRLKYNQSEGVVLDRSIGPVSHWKWHDLNEPPVLQQVMVDTATLHKDPRILNIKDPQNISTKSDTSGNDDMLTVELNNFIKEKSKKMSKSFKPFEIKMKALKINDNFSLRILDQATVYLLFRDGMTNLKTNIGMMLDHKEIVDTIASDVGEISNSLEEYPGETESIVGLQNAVEAAQRAERIRMRQQRFLRRAEPSAVASVDRLLAGASATRPQRSSFMANSPATIPNTACTCTLRKLYLANIYCDNRIIS